MRLLTIIFLSLMFSESFAQYERVDRGSGENLVLATGRSNLAWIEMNKPHRIQEYLAYSSKVDTLKLIENCKMTSNQFPFDNFLPLFFRKDDNSNFYERTYFTMNNGEIEYLLQVHISLISYDGAPKVSNIEFRKGDDIEELHELLDYLERERSEELVIPPPPPPPGLPVKH